MIRTPLFPIETYKKLFCDLETDEAVIDKVMYASEDDMVNEAIAVSSMQLTDALNRLKKDNDNKKNQKVLESLCKYLIRMSTRTTPYGLFAGVSYGHFADETNLFLEDRNSFLKKARVDMEWLYGIIKKIEDNELILNSLKVKVNNLVAANGNRLDVSYVSNLGQNNENSSDASIRYTEQVRGVINAAKELVCYGELLQCLQKNNPNVPEDTIKRFLNQLLQNEYLISELRPNFINTSPLDYVISKIKGIEGAEEIYLKLFQIQELIKEYNYTEIGKGDEVLRKIISLMEGLFQCKNYIQVDMKIQEKDMLKLNNNIALKVEKVANLLPILSDKVHYYDYLKEYYNDFVEKYGSNREISLVELLDEDKGLGAPAGYNIPSSNRTYKGIDFKTKKSVEVDKYLLDKIIEGVKNSKEEVVLTDDEINKLENEINYTELMNELPASVDMGIQIAANSTADLENGNYNIFISPTYGTTRSGKIFGRFNYLFGDEITKNFEEIHEEEKSILGEDVVIAELVEVPQVGRLSNISINKSVREYEINISTNNSSTKKEILVSDLYIGVENGWFYIKSKSLNKKVDVTTNHVTNHAYLSNIGRFLLEISTSKNMNIFNILINNRIADLVFIPRIKYDNVVLFLASWQLSLDNMKIGEKDLSLELFNERLSQWRREWNIPQFVYLRENDNRLLLNLENYLHKSILYNLFKVNSKRQLIITEIEDNLNNGVVKSEDGTYLSEFIVPLVKNKKYIPQAISNSYYKTLSNYTRYINNVSSLDKIRTVMPGGDWLYLKMYGNFKRQDEFIGFEMLPFCQQLVVNKEINSFFFLRYADPDKHIRLRLKGDNKNFQGNILPKLNSWFKTLIEKGLLTKVVIDTYEKEIERYGGPELIELAENIFCKDSVIVSNIINLQRSGQITLSEEAIAVANIVNIMEGLNIDYSTQRDIFMTMFDQNGYRDIFQKDRRLYLSAANSSNDWIALRKQPSGEIVHKLFEIRRDALNIFGEKMECLDKKGELYNNKLSIVMSIIHMFCNRFKGNQEFERKVMSMTRHSLHGLEYVKKSEALANNQNKMLYSNTKNVS